MRVKLTCPNCGHEDIYDDTTYDINEFFIAGDNFVTCKNCGEDFDFCLKVEPVKIDEPIQQADMYQKLEEE